MLPDVDLFLFDGINHLDIGRLGYDTTLVPDPLKDVRLLPIEFLKLDLLRIGRLTDTFLIVFDRNMNLLEHIRNNEADCFRIVTSRREDVVDILHLSVAAGLVAPRLLVLQTVDFDEWRS